MSPATALVLLITVLITSFISGIFGMAGGLILMGVLLALLPLQDAMVLHAVTQMASNGWRGTLWWRHIRWRAVATFLIGSAIALAVWSVWRYVPSKPVALICLGTTPFLVRLFPARLRPNPESFVSGACYGSACTTLLLLTGVSGPLVDSFFLGGKLDRRQIVATKAVCQLFGHAAKLAYFGGLVDQAAALDPLMAGLAILASVAGTSIARPLLERLTDAQYRRWAGWIITTIACLYLAQGSYLLLTGGP